MGLSAAVLIAFVITSGAHDLGWVSHLELHHVTLFKYLTQVVLLSLGTGIGAAIMLFAGKCRFSIEIRRLSFEVLLGGSAVLRCDGHLLRGSRGQAGEVGSSLRARC